MDFRDKYWLMWKSKIDEMNSILKLLREVGEEIHDDADFDFVLDHVYYSQASDRIVCKFKEATKDETI